MRFEGNVRVFLISILLMILMGLFIGFDVSAPEHHPPQFDPFNTDVHDAFKLLSFFLTLMFSIIPQLTRWFGACFRYRRLCVLGQLFLLQKSTLLKIID